MYRASFIIVYYDQQMHKYLTNYLIPTCFDNIVLSNYILIVKCISSSCL